jgi:hypothetical protein
VGLKNTETQVTLSHTEEQAEFAQELADTLEGLGGLILEKNRQYGNSALRDNPLVATSVAIKVRMLDKMRRIESGQPDETEDVWQDLFGYGVLLRIALDREARVRGRTAVNRFFALLGTSLQTPVVPASGNADLPLDDTVPEVEQYPDWCHEDFDPS